MGAEVVKIERTGRGDDARAWAPPYWGEESATFMSVNRNKRSLAVDLKAPEGRAVVERLVARADVFVQSLRAGAVEELGLGWERVREINPRLVYCSVTAFGTEGPLRDRPGYDPLMQAYGGIMSITGHPGQPPARVPVSLVDMGTGMWAVMAILAALRERDRTGRGAHVTTALFDTALAWTAFQINHYLATGESAAAPGLGHRHDLPLRGLPGPGRLGHDRRRLGRALRQGVRGARRARARAAIRASATIPRASSTARRSSRRSSAVTRGRSTPLTCWTASSGRACRARPSSPSTGSPPSRRRRRAACSRPSSIRACPTTATVGLPIRWDGERPRRDARAAAPRASTPPRCWPSWATTPAGHPGPRGGAMSSSYKTLNVTRSADGYVVTVELNRPEALNAMNTAMGRGPPPLLRGAPVGPRPRAPSSSPARAPRPSAWAATSRSARA